METTDDGQLAWFAAPIATAFWAGDHYGVTGDSSSLVAPEHLRAPKQVAECSTIPALFDTDQDGRDLRGWIVRSSYAVRGLVYLVLMFMTATLTLDMAGVVGDEPAEKRTRSLLGFPLGTWLVAALGVGLIGVGLWQFLRAYRCRFIHNFDRRQLSRSARCLILWTGRFGLAARGITFSVIGGFLILAGVQSMRAALRIWAEPLQVVAAQTYGPALLGTVAAGFIAYGVACFAYALSGTIDAGQVFNE